MASRLSSRIADMLIFLARSAPFFSVLVVLYLTHFLFLTHKIRFHSKIALLHENTANDYYAYKILEIATRFFRRIKIK